MYEDRIHFIIEPADPRDNTGGAAKGGRGQNLTSPDYLVMTYFHA